MPSINNNFQEKKVKRAWNIKFSFQEGNKIIFVIIDWAFFTYSRNIFIDIHIPRRKFSKLRTNCSHSSLILFLPSLLIIRDLVASLRINRITISLMSSMQLKYISWDCLIIIMNLLRGYRIYFSLNLVLPFKLIFTVIFVEIWLTFWSKYHLLSIPKKINLISKVF